MDRCRALPDAVEADTRSIASDAHTGLVEPAGGTGWWNRASAMALVEPPQPQSRAI